MLVHEEKCNMCRLCLDACELEGIAEVDEKIVFTDTCVSILACKPAQICPLDAIEYSEVSQPEGTVKCTLCHIECSIKPGKTGECRMYINKDKELVRTISATPYEEAKEWIGEDPDPAIQKPLLTAIGSGYIQHTIYPEKERPSMGSRSPYLVEDKVNGVEVVTAVSEAHCLYSGIRVKIDCEAYLGEEGAPIYRKGVKVGMVLNEEYGTKHIYIGGANLLNGPNGWVAAELVVNIANRERVKGLKVKGGPELELQVGEHPVVDGKEYGYRRAGCGGYLAGALGPALEGLVDEAVGFDRGYTFNWGEPPPGRKLLDVPSTKAQASGGLNYRFISPCGWIYPHKGGPGWGNTPIEDPLDLLESYDPKKLKPGFKLLFSETACDRVALYQLNPKGKFEQIEISPELQKVIDWYKEEECEEARVSAYYFGGAGGGFRWSVCKRTKQLTLLIEKKKAVLTVAGAPTWHWRGGGIGFMVDVGRVRPGSFCWTPSPCTIVPVEWTMKKKEWETIEPRCREILRPLKEVLQEIKAERSAKDYIGKLRF